MRAVIFVRAICADASAHARVRTKRHSAEPNMAKHEQMRMRKLKAQELQAMQNAMPPAIRTFQQKQHNSHFATLKFSKFSKLSKLSFFFLIFFWTEKN